jgi:hypothetical protein
MSLATSKSSHVSATIARVRELQADPGYHFTTSDLRRMLERAFEAGVNAESDRAFANRRKAMDAESARLDRERFQQLQTVAVLPWPETGSLIQEVLKEGVCT